MSVKYRKMGEVERGILGMADVQEIDRRCAR